MANCVMRFQCWLRSHCDGGSEGAILSTQLDYRPQMGIELMKFLTHRLLCNFRRRKSDLTESHVQKSDILNHLQIWLDADRKIFFLPFRLQKLCPAPIRSAEKSNRSYLSEQGLTGLNEYNLCRRLSTNLSCTNSLCLLIGNTGKTHLSYVH